MAAKLQQFFRSDDIIGRFGGDEFYIYAPGLSPEATVKRAEDLCRILHTTYDGVTVSASIGICYFPEHGRDFDKLVHLADVAAYVVKKEARAVIMFMSRVIKFNFACYCRQKMLKLI